MRTSHLLVGSVAMLIASWVSIDAAPPPDRTQNPVLSEWFRRLTQPGTSLPCCSISDCRRATYRMARDGQYEVMVEGQWYEVPDRVLLQKKGNPVGGAVACYTTILGYGTLTGTAYQGDRIEILCFVPELPTS
jgi:hypothetical protein